MMGTKKYGVLECQKPPGADFKANYFENLVTVK